MAGRSQTIRQLAREAGLSPDETLYSLWEYGIDHLIDPSDRVSGTNLDRARQILGIVPRSALVSPRYWQNRLQLSDEQFRGVLRRLGIVHDGARTLPKGSVRLLKAECQRCQLRQPQESAGEAKTREDTPPPELLWRTIGHEIELRMLTENEVLRIHEALVQDFSNQEDPIKPCGIRNSSLLGSALHRPCTSLGDDRKYPSVEMAAAALIHALVHDHPFHNGNKRTALVALLVFLDENGLMLRCGEDELFRFILQTAKHKLVDSHPRQLADREVMAMADWIHKNSRSIEKGERPIPFRELRKILNRFGCRLACPGGKGNRINISRKRAAQGRWRWGSTELKTQIAYGDEGRDVERNTIVRIRRELQLDDEHGIDSRAFYGDTVDLPGEFIVKYRKTLSRLARL
ncbi:MAG TPA: hypothetical protein DD670_13770 [Planctomycetaceae bacterium]|nr:hypothetical protein [Planctomycetaceae bacterium]